jgi:hypothetical protein
MGRGRLRNIAGTGLISQIRSLSEAGEIVFVSLHWGNEYSAAPSVGQVQIARGAVFTYYEFTHHAEDRLTDEKWRALLDTPQAPKTPAWTKSFISHIDKEQYGQ